MAASPSDRYAAMMGRAPTVPITPFIAEEYGSVETLLDFCRRLPKCELHAHLNGSIDPDTLRRLAERKLKESVDEAEAARSALEVLEAIKWKEEFDIKDFFPLFKHIYGLTNDTESLAFIAKEVLEDFAEDGVRYLEMRSTPRSCPETGMTRSVYIQTLVQALATSCPRTLRANLIVSIDRAHPPDVALDVVTQAQLARTCGNEGSPIVGLDLCGNPHGTTIDAAWPALQMAKTFSLPLTLHMGEIADSDAENRRLLALGPRRLGHATFMSDDVRTEVFENRIPVEMCMTSNVLSRTVTSYAVHHAKTSLRENHPFVLCTDDKGITSSPLSVEYALAASTFGLTKKELWSISAMGIDAAFASAEHREDLRNVWTRWAAEEFGDEF